MNNISLIFIVVSMLSTGSHISYEKQGRCGAFTFIESAVMLVVLSVFTLIVIALLLRDFAPIEEPADGAIEERFYAPSP